MLTKIIFARLENEPLIERFRFGKLTFMPDAMTLIDQACRDIDLCTEDRHELQQRLAPLGAMSKREAEVAVLLKTTPEKIVHELRNVLNEVNLLKALHDL